jgi:hypothetical protein|tara:strand:- start:1976 stop:2251 length:276 start_codon:yes stop_codon:yes gene_type:complete
VILGNNKTVVEALEKIDAAKPGLMEKIPDAVRVLLRKEYNALRTAALMGDDRAEIVITIGVDLTKEKLDCAMNVPITWPQRSSRVSIKMPS